MLNGDIDLQSPLESALRAQGPGKVALLGVSRGDTPVMV
jgi:hypothetical protein